VVLLSAADARHVPRWVALAAAARARCARTVPWLTRTYFRAPSPGLPTSVGGDASRIFETARRIRAMRPITGSILPEGARACRDARARGRRVCWRSGGTIGRPHRAEIIFIFGTIAAGFVFFSRSVRSRLRFAPWARRFRLEKAARAVTTVAGYRDHRSAALGGAIPRAQLTRVVRIYASGRAVGITRPCLPRRVGPCCSSSCSCRSR
jgi:hypothetical protein